MDIHIFFANVSWMFFILVMLIRPLANICLNKYIILFLKYRRLMGLVCGYAAFLHVFIFIIGSGVLMDYFINSIYWSYKNLFFWGNIGFILIIIPFITSNYYSQILLKQNWKKLQILAYPSFVFTGVHISFAEGEWGVGFFPIIVWLILLYIADFKNKKRIKNRQELLKHKKTS